MKLWVALTIVISTLLFRYPQVSEDGSFHFYARLPEMLLSVASTLTPIRQSTKATKGVKF